MAKKENKDIETFDGDEIWDRSEDQEWDNVISFGEGVGKESACLVTPEPIDSDLQTYAPFQVFTLVPGASMTLYFNGPQGASVQISSTRQANSGGHMHSGGPTVRASPSNFRLGGAYPQNVPVSFTAPAAGGITKTTFQFSAGNPRTHRHQFIVRVNGLVRLSNRPSITLTGATSSHPDNHYGTRRFVSSLEKLADAFKAQFNKPIYVNDMSLEHGGIFDIRANWNRPHATHRNGTNADVNSRSMRQEEKVFFKRKASELGLNAVEHGTPLHWHITGPQFTYT